jgi:iron complex outermembrane recepter protein
MNHRTRRHAAHAFVRPLAVSLITWTLPVVAAAEETADAGRSSPVVITGTRSAQKAFDLPMSIDLVDKQRISEGQLGVNASEALVTVPGVVANNRQNYAQDLQISIRGFGSRSTFGVRGIRLYADGIPLTMPDGQGQAANIDLATAKSIEVLRGPFSSLYGNSSGGVISVFTEDGPQDFTVSPYGMYGSFETWKAGTKVGGTSGNVNYVFNVSRFETSGYRDWSAAQRDVMNGKITVTPDDIQKFTLVVNYLNQPDTQDPLGLTAAQVAQNPRQAGSVTATQTAADYKVRKSIDNAQVGGVYERKLSEDDVIRGLVYLGDRQVTQYLGVTPGAQAPASSGGGVVDLDRTFWGVDLRWVHRTSLGAKPLSFTVGTNYDRQTERRQGYNNFIGSTVGVLGALRRDEDNTVYNFDQYAQAEWLVSDRWILSGGLRYSNVKFRSTDYFIIPGTNPDDSGSRDFDQLSPVAAALYKLTPTVHAYASFGRGFETPTFAELAYQTTTASGAGLNTTIQANRTRNYEMGLKALVGQDTRLNAAIFRVNADNEITVQQNVGGRSVFQNAGPTTRTGFELAADARFKGGFFAYGAATYIDATFDSSFNTCPPAPPCAAANVPVAAGNAIPGIPGYTLYGESGWRASWMETAIEARRSDRVFVNDTNSEFAQAYNVYNWRISFRQDVGKVRFTQFFRIDNLLDTAYVGSVIVNGASGRYYEPSPGRAFYVGASAAIAF